MTRRADSRRVPQDQADAVVEALYDQADQSDWMHLSPTQRTAQYDKWTTEPTIGGILTRYMTPESARSWIKDGPMKEYARARLGAGRYAQFRPASGPGPQVIVAHAFGPSAATVADTFGYKPFHCAATIESGRAFVSWGESRNFRHLVWACVSHLADHAADRAAVVVTESFDQLTATADRARHARIGKQCGIDVFYYRVAAVEVDLGRHSGTAGDASKQEAADGA